MLPGDQGLDHGPLERHCIQTTSAAITEELQKMKERNNNRLHQQGIIFNVKGVVNYGDLET